MTMHRANVMRRGRPSKASKLTAELFREGKCRDCSVSVTRMDFAKILGKFTKVKIQYESASRENRVEKKITSPSTNATTPSKNVVSPSTTALSPRTNAISPSTNAISPSTNAISPGTNAISPVTNARLRSNENGMVLIHRSAYKEHPAKQVLGGARKALHNDETPPRRRGRPPKNRNIDPPNVHTTMQYRIIFYDRRASQDPSSVPDEFTFVDLLPSLSSDVLPTEEWTVDYLPRNEPKKDHVYDRIAAELEDLMYDAKPDAKTGESKGDDFPSIMDLLGDALVEQERNEVANRPSDSAGANDVEAILRGDMETAGDTSSAATNSTSSKDEKPADADLCESETKSENTESCSPKKVSSDDIKPSDSIDKESTDVLQENKEKCDTNKEETSVSTGKENVETLQTDKSPEKMEISPEKMEISPDKMEVVADRPTDDVSSKEKAGNEKDSQDTNNPPATPMEVDEVTVAGDTDPLSVDPFCNNTETTKTNGKCPILADDNVNIATINYIVFKRVKNDECNRLVKCSKDLNYSIEIEGKSVELLGAPKYISCADDLRLMLQIVHECDLNSFNVVQGG